MLLPAPGWFSTMNCWPSRSVRSILPSRPRYFAAERFSISWQQRVRDETRGPAETGANALADHGALELGESPANLKHQATSGVVVSIDCWSRYKSTPQCHGTISSRAGGIGRRSNEEANDQEAPADD
jgi:hypothetical protein